MRTLCAFIVSAVVFSAASSPAHAANPPLPVVQSKNLGPGSNPTLGEKGGVRVHFNDDITGLWKFWEPSTDTFEPSSVPVQAKTCSWSNGVLFCSGEDLPTADGLMDFVYAVDLSSSSRPSATRIYPRKALVGRGVHDSNGYFAAVEQANGTIEQFEFWPWFGNGYLSVKEVRSASDLQGFPVISESYVVYQDAGAYSAFSLVVWSIWNNDDEKVVLTQPFSWQPRPSQVIGSWVSFDYDNSVQEAFVGGIWDPGMPPYDPAEYGCTSFHELRSGVGQVDLVRGMGCAEGSPALFAMVPVYDGGSMTKKAFFVGRLSSTSPSYEVFEYPVLEYPNKMTIQYHIVYVDQANQVVWARIDSTTINDFYQVEVEPNDEYWQAQSLPSWKVARGFFDSATDVDHWAVELEANKTYNIVTGTKGPGIICADPMYDTQILVTLDCPNNFAAPLGPVGAHWMWEHQQVNYCGGILDCPIRTAETCIIKVEPGPSFFERIGGPFRYYLAVEEL